MKIVIVGGGITGLSAALAAREAGAEVMLLERESRFGGKLQTGDLEGNTIELGPDSLLTRTPEANGLLESLGLNLVSPQASRAEIFVRGNRLPFPKDHILGAPRNARAALEASALNPWWRIRGAMGAILWNRWHDGDDLGELATHRYGSGYANTLIDPLVGGINANRIFGLSAEVSAPAIVSMKAPTQVTSGPAFVSPEGGLAQIVERLVENVQSLGVDLRLGVAAQSIVPGPRIITQDEEISADTVILTVPAWRATYLLDESWHETATLLESISYASVALALVSSHTPIPANTRGLSGVLVPKGHGFFTSAVSLASEKWPHWARTVPTLLRLSTGNLFDKRYASLDDEDLTHLLMGEAREILGWDGVESHSYVKRWDRAFPHFAPYHRDLISRCRKNLNGDHLYLAGAYTAGSGIPTCILEGLRAASEATTGLVKI